MGVILQSGYSLPGGDEPLTHARIAHSGNWYSGGTITASTTATGYFAEGPDNSLTYEKWKPTASTGTWEHDFTSSTTADYCCIGAHNLGTSGSTINVQYWTGAAWSDLCAATAISDDMPIMVIFAPQAATKFRLNISAGTSAPSIGVIKFGQSLQMQRALYGGHAPLDLSRQTSMQSNISETGEFLGRTKIRTQFSTSFEWKHLTAAWVRTNWRPFQLAIETEPFFIAWRPETFSEVGLCQSDEMPIPQNMGIKDFMSVTLNVRGYGYD